MKRSRLPLVLLLLGSLSAAQSPAGGSAEIEQLQVQRDGADVTIQIILTGAVKPSVETATDPDRLVLVLPGTLSDAKQKHFPLDANGVRGVRMGLNSANPPVTRVVVDLKEAHAYTLSTEGNAITLRVQSPESAAATRRNGPVPAASAPLMSVFHRKPAGSNETSANAAPAPIPVPPKFPPIIFPEKQPAPSSSTAAAARATPTATHPQMGSLQQGTVFPGMGTPGAGAVPSALNASTSSNAPASSATPLAPPAAVATGKPAPVASPAQAGNPRPGAVDTALPSTKPSASSVAVNIANAPASSPTTSAAVGNSSSNQNPSPATVTFLRRMWRR